MLLWLVTKTILKIKDNPSAGMGSEKSDSQPVLATSEVEWRVKVLKGAIKFETSKVQALKVYDWEKGRHLD